ncbi:MAG: MBL fold metallo-hydrolase [Anaerolineaceae bacterium]|nr:MBL fold metallo-hydrolase [Anaerolineaceae bacterium]
MPIHHLTVGDLSCTVLNDTQTPFVYDPATTDLVGVTWDEIRAALDALGQGNTGIDAMNCLLIQHGGTNLLVDSGLGDSSRSHLLASLAEAGLTANDIDIIFLSHFHGDHTGGLVNEAGEVVFPNAHYYAAEIEWDTWLPRSPWPQMSAERTDQFKEGFAPLKDRFTFIEPGYELLPGVTVVDARGHSPGHYLVHVHSGDEQLLYLSDTLLRLPQFAHPNWHIVFDVDKEKSVKMRKAILQRAADEHILLQVYHLPFPGLGYVEQIGEDAYSWHPLA